MKRPRPSELELQILSVLWERGPLPIRAIREALPDGKDRAYTTVLTLVQIMEKKGSWATPSQGQAHVYHPSVDTAASAQAADARDAAERLWRQSGRGRAMPVGRQPLTIG